MTRLTSLIAIDQTPSRPEGETLKLTELPLNLPAGWEFDKVFGGERPGLRPRQDRAEPSTPERRAEADAAKPVQYAQANVQTLQKRGSTPQLASARAPQLVVQGGNLQLPKTATDAELKLMAGLALLAMAILLLAGRRLLLALAFMRFLLGRRWSFAG